MVMALIKILSLLFIIIQLVGAVPLGYSHHDIPHSKTGFQSIINPIFVPIKKAQKYLNTFGNYFSPAVATPITYKEMHSHNLHKEPVHSVYKYQPIPETTPIIFSRNNSYDKTIKKVQEPIQIDQEIINKIFNDVKEIDQNDITTTEDTPVDYTPGTEDYETTTDYLLRIPAPVVATLLGR